MKADTYRLFMDIRRHLTRIEQKLDALSQALVDDAKLKALLADVKAKTAELGGALPPT
jgi:Skp family chaperone for outer membrane proteins